MAVKKTLTEAFDKIINNTEDHSDLPPSRIVLSQEEEMNAVDAIMNVKEYHKKDKTVVIQPFGRSSQLHKKSGHTFDPSARSLGTDDYFYISERIRKKYNCIVMSEHKFENDENMYIDSPLRTWSAVIEAADYFVGEHIQDSSSNHPFSVGDFIAIVDDSTSPGIDSNFLSAGTAGKKITAISTMNNILTTDVDSSSASADYTWSSGPKARILRAVKITAATSAVIVEEVQVVGG